MQIRDDVVDRHPRDLVTSFFYERGHLVHGTVPSDLLHHAEHGNADPRCSQSCLSKGVSDICIR